VTSSSEKTNRKPPSQVGKEECNSSQVLVEDLNLENLFPTIKEECGISSFAHVEGASYTNKDNLNTFLPVLGLLVVMTVYITGYCKFARSKQDESLE
jgi:hypothetical protein